MTNRQRTIRESGIEKARIMAKEYQIDRDIRNHTLLYVKATLILMVIAIIQSIYILL